MGGLCKMLMFAYIVGGWVRANAYVSKTWTYDLRKDVKIQEMCNHCSLFTENFKRDSKVRINQNTFFIKSAWKFIDNVDE